MIVSAGRGEHQVRWGGGGVVRVTEPQARDQRRVGWLGQR